MILRDSVQVIDSATDEPIATLRAAVSYRTASLDQNPGGGPGFQITQQLTALTEPYEWDQQAHRLRFRGADYQISGLLWRRRDGRDHHVTVELERTTG